MGDKRSTELGFTLVEILLVVVLIGGISAVGIPVSLRMQNSNNIQVASDTMRSSLREAQALARASSHNDNWGVHIATGQIVVFQGSSYATRTVASDRTYSIASNIYITASPSGMTDVIFFNTSGNPSISGSITLTLSNFTRIINLNEKGAIL